MYAEISLLVFAGCGLWIFLLRRFGRSLRSGSQRQKIVWGLVLVSYLGAALVLCDAFLPCFPLSGDPVCHGPRSGKRIALTFDDGPNEPYTSQILDVLKDKDVPATFFLVGQNVERYPETTRRILREGLPVGNHTWDHQPLVCLSPAAVREELEGWEKAMAPVGLPGAKIFRAPHGWKTPIVSFILKEKGYRLIGWSRGVWDSDRPDADVLFHRLTDRPLKDGDILLLHDGAENRPGIDRSQTVAVLPRVIDYYKNLGFRFVTIPDMLKER